MAKLQDITVRIEVDAKAINAIKAARRAANPMPLWARWWFASLMALACIVPAFAFSLVSARCDALKTWWASTAAFWSYSLAVLFAFGAFGVVCAVWCERDARKHGHHPNEVV